MKCWILKTENNELKFTDNQLADFHDYSKERPKMEFRLEPIETKRTLSQNNYYWMYLEVIARETGNEANDLHEFFKQKFITPKVAYIKGKQGIHEIRKYPSTTEMKKLEFSDYLDRICALVDVPLPDPKEAGYFTE